MKILTQNSLVFIRYFFLIESSENKEYFDYIRIYILLDIYYILTYMNVNFINDIKTYVINIPNHEFLKEL